MMESLHELQTCRHRNHSKPSSSENSMEVVSVLLFFWVLSSASIIFKTLEQVRTSQPKQFYSISASLYWQGGFCGLWLPPIRFPSLQIEKLIRDGISAHQFGSPFPQSTTSMASANLTDPKRGRSVRCLICRYAVPLQRIRWEKGWMRPDALRVSGFFPHVPVILSWWMLFFDWDERWEIIGDHAALKVKARWSAMAPRHCPCQLWTKWQLWENWQRGPCGSDTPRCTCIVSRFFSCCNWVCVFFVPFPSDAAEFSL